MSRRVSCPNVQCFNPRLPGGRRPNGCFSTSSIRDKFQSTPSGGKATAFARHHRRGNRVSIHAFRGEGDAYSKYLAAYDVSFNPRLPGGRRLAFAQTAIIDLVFQSTPSGGKATRCTLCADGSIRSFNPRLPGGRRHVDHIVVVCGFVFQSTPSGGKAT